MTPHKPNLETVVTVVSGHTMLTVRKFKWGDVVPQFSIGSQGDWIVSAPGVASIHLLLTFDGRQLHAASVAGNAPVFLDGTGINERWNAVKVPSELSFGQARLRVSCEPCTESHSSTEAPPSPVPMQLLGGTARLEAARPSDGRLDATRLGHAPSPVFARGAEAGGTQLLADYREELERRRRSSAPPAGQQFQAEALPLRVLGRPTTSPLSPAQSTSGKQAPPVTTLPLAATPTAAEPSAVTEGMHAAGTALGADKALLNSTVAIPPSKAPKLPPFEYTIALESAPPAPTEFAVGKQLPTLNSRQLPAGTGAGTPMPSPMLVKGLSQPAVGIEAGSEGDAEAIAPRSVPAALAITEPPFSTVSDGGALREFAARIPESPRDASPGGLPALAPTEDLPLAAPEGLPSAPPSPVAIDPRHGSGEHLFDATKQPTSWVKKLTLVLFALAAGLMLYSKLLKPKLTTVAANRAPAASVVAPGANASAAPPAASALTSSGIGGTSTPAKSALPGNSPSSDPPAPAPERAATTAADKSKASENPKQARAALDAAFEGRLSEAAARYKALADSPVNEVYALAAHYAERGNVRIP